ncbi:hypothetical protein D3C72_2483900 [compost metagenome]
MPRPICCGLTPPRLLPAPPGAVAASCSCETWSAKLTRLALKPVVLTLAMLLPITSMRVWWLRMPLMPE